jgi:hypothetical protein
MFSRLRGKAKNMIRGFLVILMLFAVVDPARAQEPGQIAGDGATILEAQEDARHRAYQRFLDHLREQSPPITVWEPTEEEFRRKVLDGPGREGPSGRGGMKRWILSCKSHAADQFQRWDRQAFRGRVAFVATVAGNLLLSLFVASCWLIEKRRQRRDRAKR